MKYNLSKINYFNNKKFNFLDLNQKIIKFNNQKCEKCMSKMLIIHYAKNY